MIRLFKKLLGLNEKISQNSPEFDLPQNFNELVPTRELILTAKAQGIDFGTGNPLERVRYLIKLGLLPYAVRKTITDIVSNKSKVEGHLPVWTIERLRQIQNLNKQGVTVLEIKQKVSQDLLKLFHPDQLVTKIPSIEEPSHHPPGLPLFKTLNLSRLLTPGAYLFIGGIALILGLTIAYKIDPDQTKVLGQKIANTKILSPINSVASLIAGIETPEEEQLTQKLATLPSQNPNALNQGLVLAESSPSSTFLEINLDTNINGSLQASVASIAGTLSSASINTGFGDNEVYPMNQAIRTTDNVGFANLTLTGNGNVGGTLAVTGASTLTGAVTASSTLAVSGATTLSSTLAVTGATTLSDTLKVSGASTLTGAVVASSTLAVSGATTLSSTLAVSGASTLNGAVTAGSTLAVSGTSTLSGAVTASSTLAVSGATTLSSTLDVTGATNLSSYLQLAQITAPSTTTDRLYNVSGDLTWNGVNITAGGAIPVGTNGQTIYNSAGTWTATSNLYHNGTNVGIGTTTPNSKLAVIGGAVFGSDFGGFSAPTNGLLVEGNTGIGGTSANYQLDVWGSQRVTGNSQIDGALSVRSTSNLLGNVGVGASSANYNLDVWGTQRVTGNAQFDSQLLTRGNVGVGATSANYNLDVWGTQRVTGNSQVDGNLSIRGTSTLTGAVTAATSISTPQLTLTGNNSVLSFTGTTPSLNSGANSFSIFAGGNVGIGTSATLNSTFNINGNQVIGSGYIGSTSPSNGLAVQGNLGVGTSTANSNLSVAGNAHIGSIYQGISAPTNGLFVDGNVGIGATTSTNKLDVWGNQRVAGNLTVDTTGFFGNVGIGATSANYTLDVWGSQRITGSLNVDSTSTLANALIGYQGAVAPTNGLAVAGNVGIGTTSPSQALDVVGSTNISQNLTLGGTTGITSSGNGAGITFTGTGNHDISASSGTLRTSAFTSLGSITLATSMDLLAAGSGSDIGTSGTRFSTGWFDTLDAINIAGTITGGSTNSSSWTVNADNSTDDAESASLAFERGSASPNAVLGWDHTTKQFTLNSGINLTGTILPTWGINFGGTTFDITSNLNEDITIVPSGTGNVGIGTTVTSQKFQVNSGSSATVITSTGNIGIGTTTVNNALSVNGAINVGTTLGITAPTNGALITGNVGIGGTSANYNLDVWGNSRITGLLQVDGGSTHTSTISIADGSASTPGLNFANDTDSGLWRIGANQIALTTAGVGTSGLAINGNGNVGIGTTTVNSKLTVVGNLNVGSNFSSISAPTNGLFVEGNVGIGATTSTNKLDVWGNSRIAGSLTVDSTATVGSLTISNGQLLTPNGSASLPSHSFTNLTNAGLWTNGNGLLLTTGGSATSGLAVTAGGNVGIGTTAPEAKLHVSGSILLPNNTALQTELADGTNETALYMTSGNTLNLYNSKVNILSSGNVGIGLTSANSQLSVSNNVHIGSINQGISAPTNGLLVDGNVGIGGTSAAYNLDVWGSARVTGALTTTGGIVSGSTLSIVDGSASTPGLNFANDTDSGLWRIGANQIALTTAGGAHSGLSINSNGNVGIGNTSAANKLEVNGSINIGSALGIAAPTNGALISGNVGIGGTSANYNLDVWGTQRVTGNSQLDGNLLVRGTSTLQGAVTANNFSSSNVTITGGTINNTTIGASTAASGAFTTLTTSDRATVTYSGSADSAFSVTGNSIPNWNLVQLTGTGLTSGHSIGITGGSAMTLGSALHASSFTYTHAALDDEGSVIDITFTDASANENNGGVTNGISIASNINVSGGAGIKSINGLKIQSPGTNTCSGTGVCNWSGIYVEDPGTLSNTNLYAAIFAGGNVGIGFTSPTAKLELWQTGSADAFRVRDVVNDTTPFVINADGNVGIGISVPTSMLHLSGGNIQVAGGVIDVQVGSASSPSYQFINNTTTGMYSRTTNTLDFSTAGTFAMEINANGNLGIGTSNPLAKLAVNGDAVIGSNTPLSGNSGGKLFVENTTAGATNVGLNLINSSGSDNTGISIDFTPNTNISLGRLNALRTNTGGAGTTDFIFSNYKGSTATLTETLRIKGDSGNVGIGMTSPVAQLQVKHSAGADSNIILSLDTTVASNARGGFQIYRGAGGAGTKTAGFVMPGGAGAFLTGSAANDLVIGASSSQNILFGNLETGTSEYMRITSTGNVGIGATIPLANLDVNPQSGTAIARVKGTSSSLILDKTTSTLGNAVNFRTNGADKFILGTGVYTSDDSSFDIGNGSVSRFRIDTNGNIGIGFTSPLAKLHMLTSSNGIQQRIETNDASAPGANVAYTSYINPGTGEFRIGREAGNGGQLAASATAYAGVLNVTGAYPLQFATNNSIAMTVANGGNVGIGTANPTDPGDGAGGANGVTKLYLNDQTASKHIKVAVDSAATGGSWVQFLQAGASTADIGYSNSLAIAAWVNRISGVPITFYTNNGSAVGERLRITGAGNLGIGFTSPSEKLVVSGGNALITSDTGGTLTIERTNSSFPSKWSFVPANYALGDIVLQDSKQGINRLSINSSGTIGLGGTITDSANMAGSNMILNSSGNLGIGTTSPLVKAQINGQLLVGTVPSYTPDSAQITTFRGNVSGGAAVFAFGNHAAATANNEVQLYFGQSQNDGALGRIRAISDDNGNNSQMRFQTLGSGNFTNPLTLTSTGNVGVGFTSPTSSLYVSGNATIVNNNNGAAELRIKNDTTGASAHSAINFYNGAVRNGYIAHCNPGATGCVGGGSDMQISNQLNGPLIFRTNDANRVWINGDGNVGIGITNPASKLHIYSTANALQTIEGDGTSTNYGALSILNNHDTQSNIVTYGSGYATSLFGTARANFGTFYVDGANSNGMMLGTITAKPIIIGTNNAENIRVESGGNVGIGFTSPSSKLYVKGQLTIEAADGGNSLVFSQAGQNRWLQYQTSTNLAFYHLPTSNLQAWIRPGASAQNDNGWDSATIDYAEYMEKLNHNESMEVYEVVGVKDGKITKNTEGVSQLMVTSTDSGLRGGNKICLIDGVDCSKDKDPNWFAVAFIGQMPVLVDGDVKEGDFIIPSGNNDGKAIAISPDKITLDQYNQVIGKAWENSENPHYEKTQYDINASHEIDREIAKMQQRKDNSHIINVAVGLHTGLPKSVLSLGLDGSLIVPKIKTDSLSLKDLSVGIGQESTGSGSLSLNNLTQVGTDASESSSSANLAYLDLGTTLKTLQDKITGLVAGESTTSAQLANLSDSLASNSAELAETKSTTSSLAAQLASASADLVKAKSDIADLQLTPPDVLLATGSAQLADLDVSNQISTLKLESIDATISGVFKSLGETSLGNTTIAGTLAVDGTLSFTGDSINSISTSRTEPSKIGVLYIQDSPLASLVDLFNGKVTIDNTGKLAAESLSIGSSTLGEATVAAGSTEIIINNVTFTDTSKVFLTPVSNLTGSLIVPENQPTGSSFKVQLTTPNPTPIKFNYLIIEQKN